MDKIVKSNSIEKAEDIPEIPEGWMAIEIPHAYLELEQTETQYTRYLVRNTINLTIRGEHGCCILTNEVKMPNWCDKKVLVLVKDE